jgi:uncharacterized membrane protein
MVIEESISINAPVDKVWKTFTDLTCWVNWNSVLKDVTSEHASIQKGKTFSCSMRPFLFAVSLEPYAEELIPNERVVWSASKYGIFARHEFIFQRTEDRVRVTSRETFQGITIENMKFIFPAWRIRELTKALLSDLKKATEAGR